VNILIQWDSLIAEMLILAAITGRTEKQKEQKERKNLIIFIDDDLKQRLRFIDESQQFKDYKPFFTDMWDAIVLAGNQSLLPFNVFQNLHRTYSWMKYYNNELDITNKSEAKR
jgi:hypothetical protein